MFKLCMKNYVHNLKYVFASLGVIFIMLIVGVQVMGNKSSIAIDQMATSIKETTDNTDLSLTKLLTDIGTSIQTTLDNLTVKAVFEGQTGTLLKESVQNVVMKAVEDLVTYFTLISTFIQQAISGVVMAIVIGVVIILLGIVLSGWLITVFARYDMSQDKIGKILYEQILRGLFIILWIAITVGVCYLSKEVGIVVAILYPIAYCYLALFSSWLTSAKDKRPVYAKYVTFNNMLILLGCNVVQLLISLAIGVVIYFLAGIVVAVFFALALIVLATSNANLNAYAMLSYAQNNMTPNDGNDGADNAIVEEDNAVKEAEEISEGIEG